MQEPEGYRITAYDAATQQWTILRTGTFSNGEGKPPTFLRKRLIVVCDSYQWGERERIRGREACHLEVGRMYTPNLNTSKGQDVMHVWELPGEKISITEGEGDRVAQQFSILKYEVLP
jgi:hypothetical protein